MSDFEFETVPAKLVRLKAKLRWMGADDDLNNYECLGCQWLVSNLISRDPRLIKNVNQGVIRESEIPHIRGECLCDQEIKYNCIIRHISTRQIYTIGSCCYKALTMKESRKQLCTVEGCLTRHGNRNYTLCNLHKYQLIRELKQKKQSATKLLSLGRTKFDFGKTYSEFQIKDVPETYVEWVKSWAKEIGSNQPQIDKLLRYNQLKVEY